ncbi:alpha/beta hydrolase [Halobacillus trueperi]|uniref:Alpha/beta hydrolase n=1 Tax=Halobacillus trueperi TaxID=156205 RepID=A0A3D8VL71_9BACI|nr:alpha/beta family hydrolase [Halobacillus trueperi]RDY70075.1 alpha/beta hydrolase [Halobacillus trueperi]
MEVQQKVVDGAEGRIAYTYIQNGSDRVCFMFSGRGYSYDHPIFYYTTMKLMEDTCDIVHVHYDYDSSFFEQPWEVIAKRMERDVSSVIEDVFKQRDYGHLTFLGKSIGTLPIAERLIQKYSEARFVLLTPLFKYELYKEPLIHTNAELLIFVGDEDHHYIKSVVESLESRTNIRMEVLKNANHSLDVSGGDTASSIEVMKRVVESIGTFVKNRGNDF